MKMEKLQIFQTIAFFSMFFGYSSYTYNRKTFAYAMPSLAEEGLSKDSLGLIASTQMLAYAFSKFSGAVLSDYLSARLMFCVGLALTGLTNLIFASSSSLALYVFAWFLNGLAQGAGWPACAKILKAWFPPSSFGTWWSVLSTSSNFAGSVAPVVATAIIINFDWRVSMVAPALVSFALAALFLFTLKNSPEDVGLPAVNPNAAKKDPKKTDVEEEKPTTSQLLSFRFLQMVGAGYLTVFLVKTCLVDWGQMYLIQECGKDKMTASAYTSCLELGGMAGAIVAGFLGDRMVARRNAQNTNEGAGGNPRLIVIIVLVFFLAVGLHLFNTTIGSQTSEIWISSVGALMGFCSYGPIAIFGVVANECVPTSIAGTAYAIASIFANSGAVIAGLPFNLLASQILYSGAFFVLEVLVVGILLLYICCRNVEAMLKIGAKEKAS